MLPRYILDYLRDGELLCPDDKTVQKKLLKEAKFFQVQGMITLLEEKTFPPLLSSVIIKNENHHSTVMSWLPPGASCSLLYRATTDGKSPADFHRCCDKKGPTFVVIKSSEYIFGGYSSKSWESDGMLSILVLFLSLGDVTSCLLLFLSRKSVIFLKVEENRESFEKNTYNCRDKKFLFLVCLLFFLPKQLVN